MIDYYVSELIVKEAKLREEPFKKHPCKLMIKEEMTPLVHSSQKITETAFHEALQLSRFGKLPEKEDSFSEIFKSVDCGEDATIEVIYQSCKTKDKMKVDIDLKNQKIDFYPQYEGSDTQGNVSEEISRINDMLRSMLLGTYNAFSMVMLPKQK